MSLLRPEDRDTICALSTPPGVGGLAVIRVSGLKALEISRGLAPFIPDPIVSHRLYVGLLRDSASGEALDQAVLSYFAVGRSFTGEETVEISCHGSPVVASRVLQLLCVSGGRLARPGEFTYRAFMNGRLDLVQAEAVLGLIEGRSQQAAGLAMRQLRGELSQVFGRIEDGIVWAMAHLEASIDFSAEDIEVVPSDELLSRLTDLAGETKRLLDSYRTGRVMAEGLEIVLSGAPNVGKSSLLNAFLKHDRAIVTPIAGTTRDTIDGKIAIKGIPVTFIDTAGLRDTEDFIEKQGIERSRTAMREADLIFHVVDASDHNPGANQQPLTDRDLVLLNKIDLAGQAAGAVDGLEAVVGKGRVFPVSAVTGAGIAEVEDWVSKNYGQSNDCESAVVTQTRHREGLEKIHSCLTTAIRLIKERSSPEFTAFELGDAVRGIHYLLGKEFDEQVIDRIFKEFCLGK